MSNPSIKHKASGPPIDVAPAEELTDWWCPNCGWIRAGHTRTERGYGLCCTACTRRTGHPTHVEGHWGPCPDCRVQKVYRPATEPSAPPCGACQGILRGNHG